MHSTKWRKSTYCGNPGAGNCIEVGLTDDGGAIMVRDTQNLGGQALQVRPIDWQHFLDDVRGGALPCG